MPDEQNDHPEGDDAPKDDSAPPPESAEDADAKPSAQREHIDPSDVAGEYIVDPKIGFTSGRVVGPDGTVRYLDYDPEDVAAIFEGKDATTGSQDDAIASRRYHEERLAERVESVIPDMPDMFPEHESETESVMPDMPDMFPAMHESESAPASSWAFPFGWSVIAAAAFILAVAVGGFLLFGGGPDGGEVAVETPSQPVEAAPDPAADVPAADDPAADAPAADAPATNAGSSLESSSSGSNDGRASPAATPTDSQPDVCEVAASQPSTMSFRSPDVGPAISRLFWFVSAFDLGFPTPAFEWEDVPKATTLLLITVQEINDDEAEGIANGTSDLVADGWPSAAVRWKATIPSILTSLDRTWFTGGGEPDDTKLPVMMMP